MLKHLLPPYLGNDFWSCTINLTDIELVVSDMPPFWADVVRAWFYFTWQTCQIKMRNDVLQQIIWFNSNIKVNNKWLSKISAIESGLLRVRDIVDTNGNFIPYNQLTGDVKVQLTWLDYAQICSAIPQNWTKLMKDKVDVQEHVNIYEFMSNHINKKVTYVYNKLTDQNDSFEASLTKLNKIIKVEREEYLKAFRQIPVLTNVTLYRNFQYRVLHRIIFTNDRLYYWKKVPSQKCGYCECPKQTFQHLFFECIRVQTFWKELMEFVQVDLELDLPQLTLKKIILNRYNEQNDTCISNFLLLTAKYYIFSSKCQVKDICFIIFLRKFDLLYWTEKYNAKITNKVTYHCRKWAPYTRNVNTIDEVDM